MALLSDLWQKYGQPLAANIEHAGTDLANFASPTGAGGSALNNIGQGVVNGAIQAVRMPIVAGATAAAYMDNPDSGLGSAVDQAQSFVPNHQFTSATATSATAPTALARNIAGPANALGGFLPYVFAPGLDAEKLGLTGWKALAARTAAGSATFGTISAAQALGAGGNLDQVKSAGEQGLATGLITHAIPGLNPIPDFGSGPLASAPRAISNVIGGYGAARVAGQDPSQAAQTAILSGLGTGPQNQRVASHIADLPAQDGLNHAARTYGADVPETSTRTVNGVEVNEPFKPKTYENLSPEVARQLLRNGPTIDPNTVPVNDYGSKDQGTATIHTDPNTGEIVSWSTDNKALKDSVMQSTVVSPQSREQGQLQAAKGKPADLTRDYSTAGAQARVRPPASVDSAPVQSQNAEPGKVSPPIDRTQPNANTETGSGAQARVRPVQEPSENQPNEYNKGGYGKEVANKMVKNMRKAQDKFGDTALDLIGKDPYALPPEQEPRVQGYEDHRLDKTKDGIDVVGQVLGERGGKHDVINYTIDDPAQHRSQPGKVSPPIDRTQQAGQVENKFVTSARDSSEVSPEAKSQLEGTHQVRSNKELVASAEARIADNETAAHQFAIKGDSDEAFATAISLAKKYRAEGKHDLEAQVINETARNGLDAGRKVQALSLLKSMSPEGIAMTAAREVQSHNEPFAKKVENEASSLRKSTGLSSRDTGDSVSATVQKLTAPERLAKKVGGVIDPQVRKSAQDTLVNELFSIAKKSLPEGKVTSPQAALEKVKELFSLDSKDPGVYEQAKKIVMEKYGNNPKVAEALEKYEKSTAKTPVSQATTARAVSEELASRQTDLRKIVTSSPADQEGFVQDVAKKMVQEGFSPEAAKAFSESVKEDLSGRLLAKKQQMIEELRRNAPARSAATLGEKIDKLQSLGVLSDEDYHDIARAKLKLPSLGGQEIKAIGDRAEAIQNMPEGRDKELARQKLWEHISTLTPSSWGDKFLALRRSGLLTAPATLTKVVGSHVGMSALEQTSNVIAGKIVDPAVSLARQAMGLPAQRGIVGTGQGLVEGTVRGAKEGVDNLVHGYNPHENPESILRNRVNFPTDYTGPVGAVRNAVNRGLQNYVDTTGRVHASLPMAGAEGARTQSLYDQAHAAAKNQGITGDAVKPFVDDFVRNPSDAAAESAQKAAEYASFQNKTALGEAATAAINKLGFAGKFQVPFTKVPAALITAITDYSPVGAVKAIYNAARSPEGFTPEVQAAFSKEIGRSIVGTSAIAFGAALASNGLVTTKPKDQKEADLWSAQGIPYNSVKLGGTWVPLGSFGPAGTALAVGAYAQSGMKDTKKTPGNFANAALQGAVGLGTVQLDQPYLQGASSVIDALKSPQSKGQAFVHSAAGSLVPSLSASVASVLDPVKREQNGDNALEDAANAIKYRIPGLRQQLPPKADILGNQEPNTGNVLQKVFAPADSVQRDTPVTQELQRLHDRNLDATPSAVNKTVSAFGISQQLSPQQQSDYQQQVGGHINQNLQQLISAPEYQNLDDSAKQAAIQKLDALVRQRDSISFSASNSLSQTNLAPQDPSKRQTNEQVKLQAAKAYQDGNGAAYYAAIKGLPAQQQVQVADEIKQAFGDATAGKPLSASEQVVNGLKPAAATVLGSQQGALAHLNNFDSFVNKRNFELNSSDPQPIYKLPDKEASEALAVKAQLPGVSSPYISAIKAQPWYKQYASDQSAWYSRNPSNSDYVSPAGPAPVMSDQLSQFANQLAQVKAAGGSTAAYYKTPMGQQLSDFYNQTDQYDNKKLSLVNLPPAFVPSTQYPGELAAVGSAGGGGAGTVSQTAYSNLKARYQAKSQQRGLNYDAKKLQKVQMGSTRTASVKAPAHVTRLKISPPKKA